MGALASKKREYKFEAGEQSSNGSDNFTEKVVCKENEMRDGEMKEFELGQNGKVLLVKENGTFTALGHKCTHYGAPLIKGVLNNGRIRCPWHGACFNSVNGDIEDFPGLDSLPCFDVCVVNGEVKVRALLSELKNHKRVKPIVKHSASNALTYVVIGGGGAGQACIETLRQEGFSGKLILISKEKHLPYDRPKLSKALDAKAEDLYLRKDNFFKCAEITVMLETVVTAIDTEEKWVKCNDGKLLVKYDSLMIATGGSPVVLNVPGNDLKNICLLRTPEEGNHIAKNVVGKDVVIVGSSFIGMEIASYLLTKARSINVIGRSDVPFSVVFGKEIGMRIKKMFEEKGVVFHTNNSVKKFIGNDNILSAVELESGDILTAEICILGVGVRPSTEFLLSSGIVMNAKGQICVNEFLESNIEGVFACGDIVEFPLTVFENQKMNVCHWQMALSHGHTAALNMLGRKSALRSVPFFWSVMCGKSFRYAGYGEGFDDVVIEGSLDDLEFVAYFCKKEKVIGVCTINKDPMAAHYASNVYSGKILLKEDIGKEVPA